MPHVADPKETQQLIKGADRFLTRVLLQALHPGALAVAEQLQQDYDFDGIGWCCRRRCSTSGTC